MKIRSGFNIKNVDLWLKNVAGFGNDMGKKKLPYISPFLNSSINKGVRRFYIDFSAYDANTGELKRKRLTKLNGGISLGDLNEKERRYIADCYIYEIKKLLKDGWHFKKKKGLAGDDDILPNISKMSIKQAMAHAHEIKVNVRGIKSSTATLYKNHMKVFCDWLELRDMQDMNIKKLDDQIVIHFLDYLKRKRKHSNKTYNHYLGSVKGLITELMRRERKLFPRHPLELMETLPVKSNKHAAYSNAQMKKIREHLEADPKKKSLLRYIQFLYYTLARPNEVRNLKIGDIQLDTGRILIQAENAKRDESFCGIPPALQEIIKEDKLLMNPADWYIFGYGGKGPGARPVGSSYFYKQNKKVLKEFRMKELNPHYTMYSYKHTGAISLYVATKDIKLLQHQLRHKNVSQTEDYLRDLGMLIGYSGLQKWEGAI